MSSWATIDIEHRTATARAINQARDNLLTRYHPKVREHVPRVGGTHYFQATVYVIEYDSEVTQHGWHIKTVWSSCLAYERRIDAEREACEMAQLLNQQSDAGTQLRL